MSDQPARDPVIDLLASTQRETQDLVTALCQVHVDHIRDVLTRDLHQQILHVVEERFSQLELALRPRMARARLEVARGLTQVLHECFLRMRRFESDRHWCEAMLDAACSMSRRCAFFSVRGEDLCFQGARGLEPNVSFPPAEVPFATAPAFHRVITFARALSITRSAAELSPAIAAMFGSDTEARAWLVPITTGDRVPGILYAEDAVDASAIEVVAVMAGAVLENHLRLFEPVRTLGGPIRAVAVNTSGAPPPETPDAVPALAPPRAVDPKQSEAGRFARVHVARLLLNHTTAVTHGRRDRNLYAALRGEIDAARELYKERFQGGEDYLTAEIVKTLALNDASLLGRDYPTG